MRSGTPFLFYPALNATTISWLDSAKPVVETLPEKPIVRPVSTAALHPQAGGHKNPP